MADYSPLIRQWAADERRSGRLDPADGTGEVGLEHGEAGRRLAARFTLKVAAGRLAAVRYQVFGCGFTIAACAAAAELAEGRMIAEAAAIQAEEVDRLLGGLPCGRDHCAQLAVTALRAALESLERGDAAVAAQLTAPTTNEELRLSAATPAYRMLIHSPALCGVTQEDRHLFACLLATVAAEPWGNAAALGLSATELGNLFQRYFPALTPANLKKYSSAPVKVPPTADHAIVALLHDYLPQGTDGQPPLTSLWLARIIATRAALPGHLWQAMGLSARPELTAAIRRHLPALAAANRGGMRWKRFLYKQLCERQGGTLCKAPHCGACSDYPLCFDSNQP